jgi:hypothetical protein
MNFKYVEPFEHWRLKYRFKSLLLNNWFGSHIETLNVLINNGMRGHSSILPKNSNYCEDLLGNFEHPKTDFKIYVDPFNTIL